MNKRKKERLAHDLMKIHGQHNAGVINQRLEQLDARSLSTLNDEGYNQFLNGLN